MKRLLVAALAAAVLACAPAAADITVKDSTGATVTTKAAAVSGVQIPGHVTYDSAGVERGTTANPIVVGFGTAPTVTIGGTPTVTLNPAGLGSSSSSPLYVTGVGGGSSVPTGTAGSPSASVLSVQGVAGGTAVPVAVSGTPTVAVASLPALPAGSAAIGSVAVTSSALPAGAATAARQDALAAALGSPLQAGGTVVSTLPQIAAVDRGGSFGTTAAQLMAANATRHFIQLQVQGGGTCYINGQGAATADYHSLRIDSGGYFESSTHVGIGAISIICTAAATAVFAREG